MTNLHDARVETIFDKFIESFDGDEAGEVEPVWAADGATGYVMVGGNDARAVLGKALVAADALLTEEMIAETAHKAMQESWTDGGEYEHAPDYIARAVLALIRGGGEQC